MCKCGRRSVRVVRDVCVSVVVDQQKTKQPVDQWICGGRVCWAEF